MAAAGEDAAAVVQLAQAEAAKAAGAKLAVAGAGEESLNGFYAPVKDVKFDGKVVYSKIEKVYGSWETQPESIVFNTNEWVICRGEPRIGSFALDGSGSFSCCSWFWCCFWCCLWCCFSCLAVQLRGAGCDQLARPGRLRPPRTRCCASAAAAPDRARSQLRACPGFPYSTGPTALARGAKPPTGQVRASTLELVTRAHSQSSVRQ